VLDLRGIKCPTTYAYTKIELGKLKRNELLDIIVYRETTAKNIAKTVEKDGNKTVFIKKSKYGNEDVWIVRARKI
jgi:TusA-related sulfurtransferase